MLEYFQFYLANDCYIQFGFGFESETDLTEIFVTPTKHFQIWINDSNAFKQIMKQNNIQEFEKLQFIDEFPRTILALEYKKDFQNHDELIDYLVEKTGEYSDFIKE